jgi:hypothetical protein
MTGSSGSGISPKPGSDAAAKASGVDLGLGEYPGGLGPGAEVKVFVPPGVGGSCLPGYPNQPLGFLVVLGSCHQCSSWLMGWYWSHIAYVCPVNWQGGPQRPASEAVRQDYGAAAWCEVTVAVHARNVTVESYRAAARTCRRKPAA